MKHNILILSFIQILLCIHFSFSQSGWYWLNPKPQGNSLSSVKFLNNDTAFVVGSAGTILKTTNAGSNWYRVITNTNVSLNSISFINSYTGFAGGEKILKTTNSGETWDTISNQTGKIIFYNNNTGYAIYSISYPSPGGTAGVISRTIDGGISWSYTIIPTSYWLNDISIRNGIIISCGYGFDGSIVVKSTNNGNSWVSISIGNYGDLQSISFLNNNSIMISGYRSSNGFVLRSTNGGSIWDLINNSLPPYTYGNHFIDNNTGFIASSNGKILKTTDSGINWEIYNTGFSGYFHDVSFNSNGHGIVCGTYGITYLTENNGTSWNSLLYRFTASNLKKLSFLNKDTGYVLADSSKIYKTTNSGSNWSLSIIDNIYYMLGFHFININTGFAVGRNGAIFKTNNGGLNWINMSMNNGVFFNDIQFINENTGYIAGSYDNNYKTTDGGNTWMNIHTGYTSLMFDVLFFNANSGFISGSEGSIYRTTNAGENWARVNFINGFINIYSMSFPNQQTGYAIGSSGRILKTTDNGINWFIQTAGTNHDFYSVSFLNDQIGYICGRIGDVYKTTNGGLNWLLQYSTTSGDLNSIFTLDSSSVIVAGQSGNILKTSTGGIYIGTENNSTKIPVSVVLHQNYPNPFNPSTRIKYDIPKDGIVKIMVFDILGREVLTLVNDYKKAGSYEAIFDGENFASGVYLYKLEARDFVDFKKMILIK